jgi:predicted enzyme related to lactoylglutathione lyase
VGHSPRYPILETMKANPIKLTFDVASIEAARATIVDRGGRLDATEWEFRGYRHCDCVDPEGNVDQLREAISTL